MSTASDHLMTYDTPAMGFISSIIACRTGYTVITDEGLRGQIELDHAGRVIRLRPGMDERHAQSLLARASLYLIDPSWAPEFRRKLQVVRGQVPRLSSPGWVVRCLGCARPLLGEG